VIGAFVIKKYSLPGLLRCVPNATLSVSRWRIPTRERTARITRRHATPIRRRTHARRRHLLGISTAIRTVLQLILIGNQCTENDHCNDDYHDDDYYAPNIFLFHIDTKYVFRPFFFDGDPDCSLKVKEAAYPSEKSTAGGIIAGTPHGRRGCGRRGRRRRGSAAVEKIPYPSEESAA